MQTPAFATVSLTLALALVLAAGTAAEAPAQDPHHLADLGPVDLAGECAPEAQLPLERGLALLHHMMYEQAAESFTAAAEAQPDCAMALWGLATTMFQPLWPGQPTPEVLQAGRALVERGLAVPGLSDRARGYLGTLEPFYAGPAERAYADRIAGWHRALEALHAARPDDREAAALYALSLLAVASPADRTHEHQRRASRILARILEEEPRHPGALHYSIHAHDNVALAEDAVHVAREYDQVAPSVPHALHMPSHIFVRTGDWPDVIAWNRRSADAALDQPVGEHTSHHFPHALDYLMYAHLQRGEDDAAQGVMEELFSHTRPQPTFISAYAYAATPARYVLERERWEEAATLPVRTPAAIPWASFPGAEAIVHFARGIGAARSGDPAAARREAARLADLAAAATAAGDGYWAEQIEIQRLAVDAWAAHGEGRGEEAVDLMRRASRMEAGTEKHPVTPGPLLPADELLGDLLMALGRPDEALEAYAAALEGSPARLNGLDRAARAAEAAGMPARAAEYRAGLLRVTRGAETTRPAVIRARAAGAR